MPVITPYDQRVLPRAQIDVRATGNDFGAQVGAAISQVGEGVSRVGEAMQQAENNQQTLAASGALNALQREAQTELEKRKVEANPLSPDFKDTFTHDFDSWFAEKSAEVISNTDNRVAQDYLVRQTNELRTHMFGQAANAAAVMYGESTAEALKTGNSHAADLATQNPSNDNVEMLKNRRLEAINTLSQDAGHKAKLAQDALNEIGVSQITAAIQKNPSAFLKSTQPGQGGVTLAPPSPTARMVGAGQPTLAEPVEGVNPSAVPPPISPDSKYTGPTDPGMEISKAGPAVIDAASQEQTVRGNLSKLTGWAYLSEAQKQHAVGMVLSETSKNDAQYVASLERRIKDGMAMQLDGKPWPFAGNEEFSRGNLVRVLGNDVGNRTADAIDYQEKFGQSISIVGKMTTAQMNAAMKNLEPSLGGVDGYAERTKLYDALQKAVAQTQAYRQKSPVEWGIQNGINGIKPINFGDFEQMGSELKRRAEFAVNLAKNYNVAPTILSKDETDTFVDNLARLPSTQRIGMFQRMRQSFGMDTQGTALYNTMMDQVSPKSPMAAFAGNFAVQTQPIVAGGKTYNPVTVAEYVLDGEIIMRGGKVGAPLETGKPKEFNEKDFKDKFNAYTKTAFRNLDATMGAAFEGELFQAAKNFAAAREYHEGASFQDITQKDINMAIDAVTGGLYQRGNSTLILPLGYTTTKFEDEFDRRAFAALKESGLPDVKPELVGSFNYDNMGPGIYAFRNPAAGYLKDPKTGKNILIDFSKPLPPAQQTNSLFEPSAANKAALMGMPH